MFPELTKQVSSMFPLLQHLQLLIFSWRALSFLSWGFTFLSWTAGHCWDMHLPCDRCGMWTGEKLNFCCCCIFALLKLYRCIWSIFEGDCWYWDQNPPSYGEIQSFTVRSTDKPENPCRAVSFEEVNLSEKSKKIAGKCVFQKIVWHTIEKLDTHTRNPSQQ